MTRRANNRCEADEGCERRAESRGLCGKHYQRWTRLGTSRLPERPGVEARFMAKVERAEGGCWLWTGARLPNGYPVFNIGGRSPIERYAHRASHLLFKDPIPEGYQIDHLCRVKHCVNPEHLEAVTPKVNTQRALPYVVRPHRTHCRRGHEFTDENTVWFPVKGTRRRKCRTCENEGQMRRYHARQAALLAQGRDEVTHGIG